jgi:hypothetical protein
VFCSSSLLAAARVRGDTGPFVLPQKLPGSVFLCNLNVKKSLPISVAISNFELVIRDDTPPFSRYRNASPKGTNRTVFLLHRTSLVGHKQRIWAKPEEATQVRLFCSRRVGSIFLKGNTADTTQETKWKGRIRQWPLSGP